MIIRLFIFLAILLMPVLSYGMECYQSGQSVPFDGYFHDDTGTLFDPTSPTAVLRITPFTGTSTYCDNTAGTDPCTGTNEGTLPAPTKLNLETGRYGGEYIIGSAAVEGTREITVKGTVPSAKTTGKVVSIFQVRNTCPTSILVVTDNIGLNLDDTSGTLSDAEIETITVNAGTVSDKTGYSISGTITTLDTLATTDVGSTNNKLSNIKTDTAAILADTGTDGVVVASGSKSGYSIASGGFPVGGFASGAITADAIATDAIGALEIAAGAIIAGTEATGFSTPATAQTIDMAQACPGTPTAGTMGDVCKTDAESTSQTGDVYLKVDTEIGDIQNRLPSALVGGKMDSFGSLLKQITVSAGTTASAIVSTGSFTETSNKGYVGGIVNCPAATATENRPVFLKIISFDPATDKVTLNGSFPTILTTGDVCNIHIDTVR